MKGWLARSWYVFLAGAAAGLGMAVWIGWEPSLTPSFILSMGAGALLGSPFSFKTAWGRAGWMSWGLLVASLIVTARIGLHAPLGWLSAGTAALAYATGVCLRWRPPPESKTAGSP
jgi:hypothetical protein